MRRAEWDALVVLVSQLEGVPEKLIEDHRDDGHGHCQGCHLPQSGDTRFPCTLYNLAVASTYRARRVA